MAEGKLKQYLKHVKLIDPNWLPFLSENSGILLFLSFQILAMIFTFSLTLAAGVVCKGATFFMISQSAAQVSIDVCPSSFVFNSFLLQMTQSQQ